MKRVLLLDTNFSAAPIYNYLVQSGYEVFVMGGKPNDFLAKSVKNYINSDYSDIDRTRGIIEELKMDYIVPGGNDLSYQVCAELNSKRKYHGIDTVETTEIINNKYKFRTFATQIGVPVPQVVSGASIGKIWPVIIKPVDAYSGHGMTIVRETEKDALLPAIDRAKEYSRSKKCIIEEFVEGQLYSHSAFIADGNIFADFIVEEYSIANPFVVDTSRVIYDFPSGVLSRIRDSISLLAKKLNLVDGLVHTQFKRNGESFWLIEMTRRCPGDLYSQLIALSTGFNYAETYARPFIQEKYSFEPKNRRQSWLIRHTISQTVECILGSIQFNFPVLLEKIIPLSLAGDTIQASPFSRIAIIFLRANSEEELLELYCKAVDRSLYTIHKKQ